LGHLVEARSVDKDKLGFFRDLLLKKVEDLCKEAEKTVGGMTGEKESFPDPTDRASVETHRNFQLRIRDRERKLINKIQRALNKIEEGTFGVCEDCGGEISEDRLNVRPFTSQCIRCKKEMEEKERKGGLA